MIKYIKAKFAKYKLIELSFFRRVLETFATKAVIIVISIITSVMVARSLGAEGRGVFAVAAVIGSIGTQLGNFGLHMSNTYTAAKDNKKLPILVSNSLIVSFGLGSIVMFSIGVLCYLMPNLVPISGTLLAMSLLWIPFGLAHLLLQSLLLGIQDIKNYNKVELTTKIISVVLTATVIFLKLITVEIVFLAGFIGLCAGIIQAFIYLYQRSRKLQPPSISLLKNNLGYGFQNYLICLLAYLILRSDLLLVDYFMGSKAAGLYSVSQTIADMSYLLPGVLGSILFPRLVSSTFLEARKATIMYSTICFTCVIAILFISLITLKPLIIILYGRDFAGATNSSLLLILAMAFYTVGNIVGGYTLSFGSNFNLVILWFLATVLNIGLNFKLIPMLGLSGAAISTLLVYIISMIVNIIIAYRTSSRYNRELAS